MKRWQPAVMNARTPLFASPVGLVENVVCAGTDRPGRESFSPDFQVAVPYRGVFIWDVGNDAIVGDVNQILFVTGGEAYRYCAVVVRRSAAGRFHCSNHRRR